jgi:hypothetical protein
VIGSTSLVRDGRAPVNASVGKSAGRISSCELKLDKAVENEEVSVSELPVSSPLSACASSSVHSTSSVGTEVEVAVSDADEVVDDALHQTVEEGNDDDATSMKPVELTAEKVAFEPPAARGEDTVVCDSKSLASVTEVVAFQVCVAKGGSSSSVSDSRR